MAESLTSNNMRDPPEEERTCTRGVIVELREPSPEDQLSKAENTNNNNEEILLLKVSKKQYKMQKSVNNLHRAMISDDPNKQLTGTRNARQMSKRSRAIDLMIQHNIVPICVRFLDRQENPPLQLEAAWTLANIAAGTSEHTKAVIDADAVPSLVALLQSPVVTVADQAVWALANIAGDSVATRDFVLSYNVTDGIIGLIEYNTPLSVLSNIVWLISNLCLYKKSPAPFQKLVTLLAILSELLNSDDVEILSDICWTLSDITDLGASNIQAVVDTGAVPRLVNLMDHNDSEVVEPVLRTMANISSGTDLTTDVVIDSGALPILAKLLQNSRSKFVKLAAFILSNITAGNQNQLQEVLNSDIFYVIRDVLEKGDPQCQKEAAWAVKNAVETGTELQALVVFEKYNLLEPYLNLLPCEDAVTVEVVLTGLQKLLSSAELLGNIDGLCLRIEELDGLNKLEPLILHENERVADMAFSILNAYYKESSDLLLAEIAEYIF